MGVSNHGAASTSHHPATATEPSPPHPVTDSFVERGIGMGKALQVEDVVSAGLEGDGELFIELRLRNGSVVTLAMDPESVPALVSAALSASAADEGNGAASRITAVEIDSVTVATGRQEDSDTQGVVYSFALGGEGSLPLSLSMETAAQMLDGTLTALTRLGHPLAKQVMETTEREAGRMAHQSIARHPTIRWIEADPDDTRHDREEAEHARSGNGLTPGGAPTPRRTFGRDPRGMNTKPGQ